MGGWEGGGWGWVGGGVGGTLKSVSDFWLSSRAQELCESGGGRPGLLAPNSPYGLCGRKATLNLAYSPYVELEEGYNYIIMWLCVAYALSL